MTDTEINIVEIAEGVPTKRTKEDNISKRVDTDSVPENAIPVKTRRPRTNLQRTVFSIGVVIALCILIPFAYYSVRVNIFARGEIAAGRYTEFGMEYPCYS